MPILNVKIAGKSVALPKYDFDQREERARGSIQVAVKPDEGAKTEEFHYRLDHSAKRRDLKRFWRL